MRVLISGATGLIGGEVARRLAAAGDEVWGLSRKTRAPDATVRRWFAWDTLDGALPDAALEGVDAVVHLAGEPVDGARWSPEHKRKILDTRVRGTRAIVDALGRTRGAKALIAASAVGFYGDRGDEVLREDVAAGTGFLPEVCVAWEQESTRAAEAGLRVVQHRIGIVLARGSGALAKMLPAFKLGASGRLGSGRQWFPWIHVVDAAGLIVHALRTSALTGPLNTTAPNPVTNAAFTQALGRALHRPAIAVVPRFAARLAFGEMANATFDSQRTSAEKALASGYAFQFPDVDAALRDLVS